LPFFIIIIGFGVDCERHFFAAAFDEVQQRTPYLTDFDGACTPARHTGDFTSREIGTRAASESPWVKR